MEFNRLSKPEQYELYLKYKKSNFLKIKEFLNAQYLGIETPTEYEDYLKSGFTKQDVYGKMVIDRSTYQNYVKFKKSGFATKAQYQEATSLGFENPEEYMDYKTGGYKSKEQYDWVKKEMPKEIRRLNKNSEEIRKESDDLFSNGFYHNAFTTRFILLEKKIEESYIKKNREEYPKNKAHYECFIELSDEYQGLDKDGFHKWRLLRNQITHDHIKIDQRQAETGIGFIEKMIKELESALAERGPI